MAQDRLPACSAPHPRSAGHILAAHPRGDPRARRRSAGPDTASLLDGFPARSRQVTAAGTCFDAAAGWLVTPVGARGENWGRVILACGQPPVPLDSVLIERTAAALALTRLIARQRETLERQVH